MKVLSPSIAAAAAVVVLGVACGDPEPQAPSPPPFPAVAKVALPKLPDGKLLAMSAPGALLAIDPGAKNPVIGLSRCVWWVLHCVKPGERDLDHCFAAVPRCKTSTPRDEPMCCPDACRAAYKAARDVGAEAWPAFEKTLFIDGSCFPGLRAYVGKS